MNIPQTAAIFIFGTLWGSFFYTLALRFVSGEFSRGPLRALASRSRCPDCGAKISPLFLVPVLGYIALRGRCPRCSANISPLYPAAEIIHGLLLVLIAREYGMTLYAFNIFLLCGLGIAIAVIDIRTLIIPDPLVLAFALLSLYPIALTGSFSQSAFGFLLMFLFFLVVMLIFPGSFGGGDLKFASLLGLLFGFELAAVVLETALVTGALAGIIYTVVRNKSLRTKIAFGPFLTLGMVTAFLYGRDILLIYYRIIY